MVNALGNCLDFFRETHIVFVGEGQGAFLLAQTHDFLGQLYAAFAALCPNLGKSNVDTELLALGANQVDFRLGISGELVDGDNTRETEYLSDVFHVLKQVGKTLFQRLEVFLVQIRLGNAAMVLQCANCGNYHNGIRLQARKAALDVQEFLGSQVGTETSFSYRVVAQSKGHVGCHDGIAAMCDVGEGTAVHECRGSFKRLNQIGLQSILQERSHSAFGMKVMGSNGLIVAGVANNDATQALLQVGDGGCQAEDGHNLGGNRNIEAVFAGNAVGFAAQATHDVAQLTVVHVNNTLPRNAANVDAKLVAIVDMGIEQSSEQIVCRANSMEVAREMQVDFFHRDYLGIATACGAALDAEYRSQAGLAQSDYRLLAQAGNSIAQAYRRGGFTFAGSGGVDCGNQHQLTRLMVFVAEQVVVNLCLGLAVALEVLFRDTCLFSDFGNGARCCRLRNFDICQHKQFASSSWLIALSYWVLLGDLIVDHTQTLQSEFEIDFGDVLRCGGDSVRQATGCHNLGFVAQLVEDALDQAVNASRLAVHHANLERISSIGSDCRTRVFQFYGTQQRCAGKQAAHG